MINFHIISLFPQFFDSPLSIGLTGKAKNNGLITFTFRNPRDFSENRHRHIDQPPYGGGPGMIMQAEPVAKAVNSVPETGKIILLSPGGKAFNNNLAAALALEKNITLICGRYEGIDARLGLEFPVQEISVGEAVMNGGESAAMCMIEGISRFIPGFLGDTDSIKEESFINSLLEYPQFTRPAVWRGHAVPDVLLTGNHALIKQWRHNEAVFKTASVRPELLDKAPLTITDAEKIKSVPRAKAGRNLCFCLMHYPVILEKHRIGASSLTNLDVHDIARISFSYGMGPFYVVTPLTDQLHILQTLLAHWLKKQDSDRSRALSLVRPADNLTQVIAKITALYGQKPLLLGTTAQWPDKRNKLPLYNPCDIQSFCKTGPVLILLGTAKGLEKNFIKTLDGIIRPIRFLNENHLSVRSAAAIIADRILGDYN